MENLLDELKNIITDNKNLKIKYELVFSSSNNEWKISIYSTFSQDYIFNDYGKNFTVLLENAIKKVKVFIKNK